MTNYYVSPAGNDTANNGLTEATAWKTISYAVKKNRTGRSDLGAGDTVIVLPGVYNESVKVEVSGSSSGYLTIKSKDKHAAKINADGRTNGIHMIG